VDGDVGLGAHVDAGAALRVEVVQALEALLAAGAVRLEVALARLQKHAFGYNGRADSLITGEHRWRVEGDDEEEGGREEEQEGS